MTHNVLGSKFCTCLDMIAVLQIAFIPNSRALVSSNRTKDISSSKNVSLNHSQPRSSEAERRAHKWPSGGPGASAVPAFPPALVGWGLLNASHDKVALVSAQRVPKDLLYILATIQL